VAFLASLRKTLEMVKFSHSVFALPFALLALVLAVGGVPSWALLGWVLLAMVSARSAAMGMNRLADRRLDAENPRTAGRHLVTGSLSVRYAAAFTAAAAAVFLFAAWNLNLTAFLLAPLVLVVLLGYPFLKRVTALAHLGVGLALGLSPLGAWIAGRGGFGGDLRVPLVLGLGVTCWVAGFDVIYASQDVEADRRLGLHSIPARMGVARALRVAALLHVVCVGCFVATGVLAGLGAVYFVAVAAAAALLVVEHRIVSPDDLSRVNVAFFNLNGLVALLLGAAGIVDALR
jgi:4-hydroxybenzoate polyprenyltransferase